MERTSLKLAVGIVLVFNIEIVQSIPLILIIVLKLLKQN